MYVGLPFPTTNESGLRGRAGQWRQLGQLADQVAARIEQSVGQVGQANAGPTRDAFVDFMSSGGGNLASLRDFSRACQAAAVGHEIAAMTITSLKMFTIAQLTAVATAINIARAAGPYALPWLQAWIQQARAAIQTATQTATQQLMAG